MIEADPSKAKAAAGPLNGIRVLDLSQFILGPLATQILGDLGADIIKVESPQGDLNRLIGPARHPGMAALYLGMNRNKRSVVLDLKQPAAMAALCRMVAEVDVFVHSLRPDAAERLGVAYPAIRQHNPQIIYASAPGYRSDGPLRNRPAYDDVIQGESGIADMNLRAQGEARYLPTVLADKFCGHALASSIGMALFHRERTGEGQSVEVPMLETMLALNLVEHLWTGQFDEPMGPLGYDRALMKHRRPFSTLDGHICLMATSDLQWARLFTAIGRPELAEDERYRTLAARSARFAEVYGIIDAAMSGRTTAQWQALLDSYDVPNAPVRRLEDMPTDPYLVETGFFHHYRHPVAGAMVTPSFPVKYSKSPASIRTPPPCLGEHTQSVLAEFGFTADEIASLDAQTPRS
jgi:formyl-CoA transferase